MANSLWLAAGLGTVLALAGASIKVVFPGALEGLGWAPLAVTLIGLPGGLAAFLLQSVLLGEGRMVAYNGIEAAQTALTLVAVVAGFVFFDFGLTGTLAVIVVNRYLAAAVYLYLLPRHSSGQRRFNRPLARRMFAYGFRAYVAIVLSYLIVRVDLLLVNAFLGRAGGGPLRRGGDPRGRDVHYPDGDQHQSLPESRPRRPGAGLRRGVSLDRRPLRPALPRHGPAGRARDHDVLRRELLGRDESLLLLLPGIYAYGLVTILSSHFAGRGFPRAVILVWVFGIALNLVLNVLLLPGRAAWVASVTSSLSYGILLVLHMWLFAREAGGYGVLRPHPREVVNFVRVAFSRG